MLDARAFDSKLLKIMSDFKDWLVVRDYERATDEATNRIIRRQSRGSISAQNGWFMTRGALDSSSKAADGHIKNLRRSLKKAS